MIRIKNVNYKTSTYYHKQQKALADIYVNEKLKGQYVLFQMLYR